MSAADVTTQYTDNLRNVTSVLGYFIGQKSLIKSNIVKLKKKKKKEKKESRKIYSGM